MTGSEDGDDAAWRRPAPPRGWSGGRKRAPSPGNAGAPKRPALGANIPEEPDGLGASPKAAEDVLSGEDAILASTAAALEAAAPDAPPAAAAAARRPSGVGFKQDVTVSTPEAAVNKEPLGGSPRAAMRQPTPFALGVEEPAGATEVCFDRDVTVSPPPPTRNRLAAAADVSSGTSGDGLSATHTPPEQHELLDGKPKHGKASLRQPTPATLDLKPVSEDQVPTTSESIDLDAVAEDPVAADPFLDGVQRAEETGAPGAAAAAPRTEAEAAAEKKASNCVCCIS